MWCAGDFLKLTYFTVSQVPVQFVLCAIVQCSIDIVISLQMFSYRKGEPTVAPVPASRRLSMMLQTGVTQRRNKGGASRRKPAVDGGGRSGSSRARLPSVNELEGGGSSGGSLLGLAMSLAGSDPKTMANPKVV